MVVAPLHPVYIYVCVYTHSASSREMPLRFLRIKALSGTSIVTGKHVTYEYHQAHDLRFVTRNNNKKFIQRK